MATRMNALKVYQQHVTDQYADRCAFWSLKDISGELMSRTVTLTTNGADQDFWLKPRHDVDAFLLLHAFCARDCDFTQDTSKWIVPLTPEAKYMVPRHPDLRAAHRAAKIQRPKLKLHGVWAFGYCLRIAVLEENSFHGSSLVQELLALTIEDVMNICRRQHRAPPDTLVVCGDNTVNELKNTYNLVFAASMVLHHKFRPGWSNLNLVLHCNHTTKQKLSPCFQVSTCQGLKSLEHCLTGSKELRFTTLMMFRVAHTHDVIGSWAGTWVKFCQRIET